jgi:hypothetical protein
MQAWRMWGHRGAVLLSRLALAVPLPNYTALYCTI